MNERDGARGHAVKNMLFCGLNSGFPAGSLRTAGLQRRIFGSTAIFGEFVGSIAPAARNWVRQSLKSSRLGRLALDGYRSLQRRRDLGRRSEVLDQPFGIYNIELTNRCPMKCIMCARTHHMTRDQGLMDFDLFTKVIDELVTANPSYAKGDPRYEVWLHHFGESLAHPDFDRFIRYAISKNVYTGLSINPIMLTQDVTDKLLASRPSLLFISLDGHDDESFAEIRGLDNAWQRSKERLLRFLELKKERGVETRIILSMIDFPKNAGSLEAMRDYWQSVDGIDEFLAKKFETWDGSADDVNSLVQVGDSPPETPSSARRASCPVPWETLTVTWDGDVVPCCYDFNKKLVLGNLDRQSLSQIWNDSPMRALRREIIDNRVENPLCKGCEKLYA